MDPARKPSVLFVYYTYTQQTLKVVEAMAEVFRDRGCDVNLAAIELTDPRYQERFSQFPMPKPFLEVVRRYRRNCGAARRRSASPTS